MTERDAMWDLGIRAHCGNRICVSAASLTFGTINDTTVGEEALMLPDSYTVDQEVYDRFTITVEKYEVRGKKPTTLAFFAWCSEQHIAICCLFFGVHRKEARMTSMHTLEKPREDRPDLFQISIIVAAWGEMTYRYIAEIKEGTRKMARALPDTVSKGEFRRKALTQMLAGRSRWEYPKTFLMDHPTGFWESIAVPLLGEKAPMSTWETLLTPGIKRSASCGEETKDLPMTPVRPEYPAGTPLSLEETKDFRVFRPKSMAGGRFLCWGFSTHGGFRNPMDSCSMGNPMSLK